MCYPIINLLLLISLLSQRGMACRHERELSRFLWLHKEPKRLDEMRESLTLNAFDLHVWRRDKVSAPWRGMERELPCSVEHGQSWRGELGRESSWRWSRFSLYGGDLHDLHDRRMTSRRNRGFHASVVCYQLIQPLRHQHSSLQLLFSLPRHLTEQREQANMLRPGKKKKNP